MGTASQPLISHDRIISVQGKDGKVDIRAEMNAIYTALDARLRGEKLEGYELFPYTELYLGNSKPVFFMRAQGPGDVGFGTGDLGTGGGGTGGVGSPAGESGDAAKDAATEVFPLSAHAPHHATREHPAQTMSHAHCLFFCEGDPPRLTAPTRVPCPAAEGEGGEEDGGRNAGAARPTD